MSSVLTPHQYAMAEQALARAQGGQSWLNFQQIVEGFMAHGIAAEEIEPRVNVFTFWAWKAKGRKVRKGEHGVKILTFVPMQHSEEREANNGETVTTVHTRSRPRTTTVFHVSQTEPA
jgi:hypothetical protein